MHVLPTLVEDLLDVVGWSYNGVNDVVLHDIYETMLDPGKSDHPLAAGGVIPQTPCDVAANLYLQTRLAEVDIAVAAQLKAHQVLHDPMKPLRIADQNVRRSEAICEVEENWQRTYSGVQNNSGPTVDPASGHAAAAPPSSAINSRRRMIARPWTLDEACYRL